VSGLQRENLQKREIFEELGCRIETGDQIGTFRHTYTHFAVTLHAYHARLTSGTVTLHEHQDARWVSLAELDDYPMGKLDRMISQRLQSRQE
jgi:A/G-specific adenine glycosylase